MSDTEDTIKFAIIGTWLVEVVDDCTCGTGGTSYPHEQYCGYEPVVELSNLEGFKELREANECAECERLRAVVHAQRVAIEGYREEVERLHREQMNRDNERL